MKSLKILKAFTLIEILIALAVLAIALSATVITSSRSINSAQKVKTKVFRKIVAMQAADSMKLGLESRSALVKKTTIFQQNIYWRLAIKKVGQFQQVTILTTLDPTKKFMPTLRFYE